MHVVNAGCNDHFEVYFVCAPGDQVTQVPAHNFTCQCYAASRRLTQSAACQSLTKQKH